LKKGFFLSLFELRFNFDLVRLSPSPSLPNVSSANPGIFWSILSRPKEKGNCLITKKKAKI
jgi:hypothetical protein